MKYLLCFRGTNHPHDALKNGILPHGGEKGPIKYNGLIETDTAVPITPILDFAATFPQDDNVKETTIDVVIIPLPKENDQIFKKSIDFFRDSKSQSTFLEETNEYFVNTSSIQKLNSLSLLKRAKKESKNKEVFLESVYEDLGGMIWAHELAIWEIPNKNVVASLECIREDHKFMIKKITFQDENIVNPDFINLGYRKLLKEYLLNFYLKYMPLNKEEGMAYRGYFTAHHDYSLKIHSDILYNIFIERISGFCDVNKITFTHDDNIKLIESYKKTNFDVEIFCKKLLNKKQNPKDNGSEFGELKEKKCQPLEDKKNSKCEVSEADKEFKNIDGWSINGVKKSEPFQNEDKLKKVDQDHENELEKILNEYQDDDEDVNEETLKILLEQYDSDTENNLDDSKCIEPKILLSTSKDSIFFKKKLETDSTPLIESAGNENEKIRTTSSLSFKLTNTSETSE